MTVDATRACVVDLDGVVWLAGEPLPGAVDGSRMLRDRGIAVRFVTNNSTRTIEELLERLAAIGIAARPEEVVTSAQAAASVLPAGSTAFVVGADGLVHALREAGVRAVDDAPEAVVVGLAVDFDYDACDRAASFVRSGARFLATNTDATLPIPGGLRPGAGAIVAAIATAAGCSPQVAGKPHEPMARLVRSRGDVGAVIGDRPSTDGAFAAALGVPFVHVASDVVEAGAAPGSFPTLLEAVRDLLAR